MPRIDNPRLYETAKKCADAIYKKPSAFRSGYIVKKYKELGGTYSDDGTPKKLKQWFAEKWEDVGGREYPVFRPTVRVNKTTPLTVQEISPKDLKAKIALKQKIKGNSNLPKFKAKARRA
jgi:hypothetical protein